MVSEELVPVTSLRPLTGPAGLVVVGQQVVDRIETLLPLMGSAYQREVAEYAAMPAEQFAEVLETSKGFIARFVGQLSEGVERPIVDLSLLLAAGRRRQEVGISLDAAMHAFRICSRVGWTAIADASSATDPKLVSVLAGRWIEYVDRGATAFAEGHTTAASEQLRRVDARRQALVADLLAAQDEAAGRAVGARHGLRLAQWYLPVLVGAAEPFDAGDRIHRLLSESALVGQRVDHLLVLVPVDAINAGPPKLIPLTEHGPVAHGRPARLGQALAAEVGRVESLLSTAVMMGRDGVHGPEDLLLERVVREHDGLERFLSDRVLQPLVSADQDGIFRATLRAFLSSGTVRTVAEELFVHANTVTYRLRRIRECTGLDARVPEQAAQLVLALALENVQGTTNQEAQG